MSRLIPYPPLAAGLFLMWLLLTQSFSLGQAALGALAAILASHLMAALRPERVHVRSWSSAFRLTGIVIADILRSNIAVASIVLAPSKARHSSFVSVPLELRNRYALTVLALIITATPGTIWAEFDQSSGTLLVHVLDLVDEDAWIRLIKDRYEARLMEIFGP